MKLLSTVLLSLAALAAGDVKPTPPIPPRLPTRFSHSCALKPKGAGKDDTTQILAAVSKCGSGGIIDFAPGTYNITRKMTWDLHGARVRMSSAVLDFVPDVQFWLHPENTYRVIFIQSQASWFVVTGEDFEIDAGNSGGIQGHGQVC